MSAVDYREHLRRQLRFIEVSAREYDSGNRDEAIRIATSLRVLFHDTSSSISLLNHLSATGTKLLSTGGSPVPGASFWFGLTNIEIDPEAVTIRMNPKLADAQTKQMIPFADWWTNQLVYLRGTTKITRKDTVLHAANKDGGAHIDAKLPKVYRDLLDGLGWSFSKERAGRILKSDRLQYAHLAPLRQMAFEVLNSPELSAMC